MADIITDIRTELDRVVTHNDSIAGLALYQKITNDLKGITDVETESALMRMRAQAIAVAMKNVSDKVIIETFEQYPLEVISGIDLTDLLSNIKGLFLVHLSIEDRNGLRDKLRNALLQSKEQLTDTLQLGNETVAGTVGNWLKLYTAETTSGAVTNVQRARFFSQNKSVQALSSTARAVLKSLLYIFDYLKFRSETMEGYEDAILVEDETGNLSIIEDGQVTAVFDESRKRELRDQAAAGTLPLPELAVLAVKFPDMFQKFVQTASITPVTNLNPSELHARAQAFFTEQRTKFAHRVPASGVPLPNRTAALVAMLHKAMSRGQEADMVLAKEILQFVVSDRERLVNFMRHQSVSGLLQTELPPSIGEKNKEVLRQSPISPMALQALLQIVFQQRFKLSPEEAAWQSFETAQRLPAELAELKTVVTYDPGQGKLMWRYG